MESRIINKGICRFFQNFMFRKYLMWTVTCSKDLGIHGYRIGDQTHFFLIQNFQKCSIAIGGDLSISIWRPGVVCSGQNSGISTVSLYHSSSLDSSFCSLLQQSGNNLSQHSFLPHLLNCYVKFCFRFFGFTGKDFVHELIQLVHFFEFIHEALSDSLLKRHKPLCS